jgi:hypothetical protein
MTIVDRLTDADVLWASGRREGALLSVLVAVAAASREEWPDVKGDKMRFCRFLSRRMSGAVKVNRGGKSVTLESLLYEYYRNSLVHEASLSQSVVLSSLENGGSYTHVVLGMPPESSVVISEDWYWWLRRDRLLERAHRIELAGASRRRNDATPRSKKSMTPAT